jgi:hypothetical protein
VVEVADAQLTTVLDIWRATLDSPGAQIRTNGQLVLESKESMQKRGLASPDDGDALALTFAQPVAPLTPEDSEDEDEFSDGIFSGTRWMR